MTAGTRARARGARGARAGAGAAGASNLGAGWAGVVELAGQLVAAWGAWAPTLSPDGGRVAFVSDRAGLPQLWVGDTHADAEPRRLELSDDPVVAVSWSPDAQWLACAVATGGGVRTEVWTVRPDGADAARVAGGDRHAMLGPWARAGHGLTVTLCHDEPGVPNQSVLVDPATGRTTPVAAGWLVHVLDLTADGRFALVRDGTRGAQFCRLVNRIADQDFPVLPYEQTGSTDVGLLRPAPPGWDDASRVAFLVTDAGRPRRELLAIAFDESGERVGVGTMATRADAELEYADADQSGRLLVLVWNVLGRSEVELLDTVDGSRRRCGGLTGDALPGDVVVGGAMARDGSCVVLAIESPLQPRALWRLDTQTLQLTPVGPRPRLGASKSAPAGRSGVGRTGAGRTGVGRSGVGRAGVGGSGTDRPLVHPELVRFTAHDGLELTAWLYRADPERTDPAVRGGVADALPPAMISLHGGPEAQERPVFSPQHQVLAAAGITVLAPNIRGSSGFGHWFVHADDRWGRLDAIADVAQCARMLSERGLADPERIAVTGRSYGGYATLMALIEYPKLFAAGVDICGMSDLLTFYRDTEPWIAAAAVTKYGDPARDEALLAQLSPIRRAELIDVPLLVVHGELDTNVPRNEAVQLVARMRALGREVDYLELAGEGHEYKHAASKMELLRRLTVFLTDALD